MIQLSQNIMMIKKKLVVGEMKGETGNVALNNLLNGNQRCIHCQQMILVNIKKAKDVNKDIVAKISHSEYKDTLLNHKYLTYLMNRIQGKRHKIVKQKPAKLKKNLDHVLIIKYIS